MDKYRTTARTTNIHWIADSELSLPLAEVEDVELEFLLELDLDVAHDEERHRKVDVDPAVIPPHLVDLGHVGGDTRLLDLEL